MYIIYDNKDEGQMSLRSAAPRTSHFRYTQFMITIIIANNSSIIESVDSICRDSADTQYMLI